MNGARTSNIQSTWRHQEVLMFSKLTHTPCGENKTCCSLWIEQEVLMSWWTISIESTKQEFLLYIFKDSVETAGGSKV